MLKFSLISLLKYAPKQQLRAATITTTTKLCRSAAEVKQQKLGGHMSLASYTEEQQLRILEIINKAELEGLLDFDISKSRANKLHTWKKRHGPLKNVDDILLVEGFGVKVADKLYQSMLGERSAELKLKKVARSRTAPFITPSISAEQQQATRSCVSVRIGVSSVSWARLELAPSAEDLSRSSPCLLTHWQHHEITEKKLHLSDLAQRLVYIIHQIPTADCYLFENPQMAQVNNNPGSAEQQNINIQKAQVTAMLAYALCARNRSRGEAVRDSDIVTASENENTSLSSQPRPNVFYLRRFLTARLFNQLIGTERVSSEETIMRLMRIYYNLDMQADFDENAERLDEERISFRGNVQFPQELREMFVRAERYQREFLGQALLLNLTFVRLVLLQDAESIATISRGSSSKSESDREC